jgi:hypothetical protein
VRGNFPNGRPATPYEELRRQCWYLLAVVLESFAAVQAATKALWYSIKGTRIADLRVLLVMNLQCWEFITAYQ